MLGKDHPQTIRSVGGLMFLYSAQGRHAEAEPFIKRMTEALDAARGAGK